MLLFRSFTTFLARIFFYHYYLYLYFTPVNGMGIEAADGNTRVTLRKPQPGSERNLCFQPPFFFPVM